ncbi:MAG TPA: TolC family protein [Bryobacteraceae bacterium]|jgi:outer membrane protein TolC
MIKMVTVRKMMMAALGAACMGQAQVQIQSGSLPIPDRLSGSIATGQATSDTLSLTLLDAIQRGLKYNISVVDAGEDVRAARSERLKALHDLMPTLYAKLNATGQQVDLAAFGFSGFPGLPNVIGPFAVYDARAYFSQNLLDVSARRAVRARDQDIKASDLTAADMREQVVLAVTGLYLQALAGDARITSAGAQVRTAEALLKNAQDRKDAGTSPAIVVLRAQVQLQSLEQRQIYYEGEEQKDLLSLGRAIGLPAGQKIKLVDPGFSEPLPPMTLDEMLKNAYANRHDYQAAQASLRAAELDKLSKHAEKYPTADLTANYGAIGTAPNNSHGTFAVAGELNIPIFQGGRVEADELAADAVIKKRRAALDNLRGQIDNEVRTSLIDTQNSFRQVEVARSSIQLARQQLEQSQDRFRAGVTDNVEVVQAQEAVATAEENLISSLFVFNVSRAALVRAEGQAEQYIVTYLKGK